MSGGRSGGILNQPHLALRIWNDDPVLAECLQDALVDLAARRPVVLYRDPRLDPDVDRRVREQGHAHYGRYVVVLACVRAEYFLSHRQRLVELRVVGDADGYVELT